MHKFFTGCEIGAEGAKELSEMLKVNTSLRELNLDCYRKIYAKTPWSLMIELRVEQIVKLNILESKHFVRCSS